MPLIIPQIVGFFAVAAFFLSYQQKKRRNIIILNVTSRLLYILQYILLGAFSGAVLDVMGAISSIIAMKKDVPFIKKHTKAVVVALDLLIVAAGLMLYENVFSLLPIVGVLFHTTAFWINDEKIIRRVSLIGSPFWFVYNFYSKAYFSSFGDALSMVSIVIAMIKFKDKKIKNKSVTEKENV